MNDVYEFGSFRLDPRTAVLTRGGKIIHLTAKAFATLLLLVERAGSLVTKDEILAAVWPQGFIERSNLTQTIYVIRKALGDANGDVIATVAGKGYRFALPVRLIAMPPAVLGGDGMPALTMARKPQTLGRFAAAGLVAVVAAALFASSSYPGRTAPINPSAIRDYVLGRHYWDERNIASLNLGVHYFKAALVLDPSYALAYSGLADCYSALSYYSPVGPQTASLLNLSHSDAQRAIALDPNSAEAHASLAFVDEFLGPKYLPQVTQEFEASLKLNGNYAPAHEWYSWFLFNQGKTAEALAQMLRARDLEPLSPIINFALGDQLYFMHRYKQASDQWHLAITLMPGSPLGYYGAGLADEELGQRLRAERELEHGLQIAPNDPSLLGALAHTYAGAHQPQLAQRLLARIVVMRPRPAYEIAVVDEGLGRLKDAVYWLAVAKVEHDGSYWEFDIDPRMDGLRRAIAKSYASNV